MKNIFRLFVLLFIASSSLKAQKVYFIYLQTENQQPFYARMGERIYNSTSAGYLILSNLRDSTYSLNIGMQGSQSPDQPYSITVNKKDLGFVVKNFGEKGLGLFNLSSMAIIMPSISSVNTNPSQVVKTEKREDNPFTNLLAKAADDSTIKERPVIEKPVEKKTETTVFTTEKKEEPKVEIKENVPPKQEEFKKETIPVEKKEDPKIDTTAGKNQFQESGSAAQIKADSIAAAKKQEEEILRREALRKQDSIDKARTELINLSEYKRSVVKLKSESSTTTGIGLVFIDILEDNNNDTIRIFIPAETKKAAPIELKQEEKKFLDIPSVDSSQKEVIKPVIIRNNNCKIIATEDDFFKLRKRMVSERKDDDMIAEARKIFKTKCFSTVQVKNLSTLFLTDEFKYKFFDAAYQYVSDSGNFLSLQSELKDEYFINRFKAMVHQ
jgi:hypothetical protein